MAKLPRNLNKEGHMMCQLCSKEYPDKFFVAGGMCVNGNYYNVCPKCAQKIMQRPFTPGTMAEELYDDFMDYLAQR